MLFFELLAMSRKAHAAEDDEMLRKIYSFSEWCLIQTVPQLSNAAAVAFYEHLVNIRKLWPRVVPWLSPKVISAAYALWAARLEPEELDEFEELIRSRTRHRYLEYDVPT